MSVISYENYNTGVSKIILKPTKQYPEEHNFFYCDTKDLDIVESGLWQLSGNRVKCVESSCYGIVRIFFHQALAFKYLNYHPDCIDHINGCSIDNTDENLNVVNQMQNVRNKKTQGYYYFEARHAFRPQIRIMGKAILPMCVKTEDVACIIQYELEKQYYFDYNYDFLLDRRNELDLVGLQYSGQITKEEAVFRHVMRYAQDNAWYVYRYNLFNYFKEYNVKIPTYVLDDRGFMRHPVTYKALNPFYERYKIE